MYKLILTISTLVRQFCIPNPFEALGKGAKVKTGATYILIAREVFNWVAEPFVHVVTYASVGLYYDRGSAPALGSFLYLLFYCLHTFLLWLMSLAGFAVWAVMLIIALYIGMHLVLLKMLNHSFY